MQPEQTNVKPAFNVVWDGLTASAAASVPEQTIPSLFIRHIIQLFVCSSSCLDVTCQTMSFEGAGNSCSNERVALRQR